ncbi:MAG: hypothetical protein LBR07_02930 [Puniceicoccales bacterium]|nr:hypothetical protein [Puniceicoccales bacterium]
MSAVASRPTVAGGRTQVHPCREDFETADGDASTPAPAWHGELLGETRHRYEAGLEPPMPLEELERRLCAMFNKRFGYNLTKLPH